MPAAVLLNYNVVLILNQNQLAERYHNLANIADPEERQKRVDELNDQMIYCYIRPRSEFDNKEAMKLAKDAGYPQLLMECVG